MMEYCWTSLKNYWKSNSTRFGFFLRARLIPVPFFGKRWWIRIRGKIALLVRPIWNGRKNVPTSKIWSYVRSFSPLYHYFLYFCPIQYCGAKSNIVGYKNFTKKVVVWVTLLFHFFMKNQHWSSGQEIALRHFSKKCRKMRFFFRKWLFLSCQNEGEKNR